MKKSDFKKKKRDIIEKGDKVQLDIERLIKSDFYKKNILRLVPRLLPTEDDLLIVKKTDIRKIFVDPPKDVFYTKQELDVGLELYLSLYKENGEGFSRTLIPAHFVKKIHQIDNDKTTIIIDHSEENEYFFKYYDDIEGSGQFLLGNDSVNLD